MNQPENLNSVCWLSDSNYLHSDINPRHDSGPCYTKKSCHKFLVTWGRRNSKTEETAVLEWIYPECLTVLHSNCMSHERTQKTHFTRHWTLIRGHLHLLKWFGRHKSFKGGVVTILCRPRMVTSIFPVMFEAKLYTES